MGFHLLVNYIFFSKLNFIPGLPNCQEKTGDQSIQAESDFGQSSDAEEEILDNRF